MSPTSSSPPIATPAHPLVLAMLLDQLGGMAELGREGEEWLSRDPHLAAGPGIVRDTPGSSPDHPDGAALKHRLVAEAVRTLGQPDASPDLADWQATLACALLCRGLARQLGHPDGAEAYLAGLLHGHATVAAAERTDLAEALRCQDETPARLAEALPLARLLRVARAAARGEAEVFRLAAELLPELAADTLDGLRAQALAEAAELARRLAARDEWPTPQVRLAAALEDFLGIEGLCAELAGARGEAAILAAALIHAGTRWRLQRPFYLAHDTGSDSLLPAPGSPHPGLRIRLSGSHSAATWAMSSRQPVVFSTADAESVCLLDVQLARLAGATAVVAIPVGAEAPVGVLLGCVDLDQAPDLERASAYLARFGRCLGAALARAGSARAEAEPDPFRARVRRAAHEIGNPLGIVRNYLALLGARLAERGEAAEELGIIREELDRIPRLLQGLAGDEPGPAARREECDLAALVRDLARMAESSVPAGKRVRVAARIEPNLPTIRSDAGKLRQLLLNLVLNALDACPEEGLVGLDAYTSIDLTGAKQVLIGVRDNGAGIASDKLARLYEPVGTTKGGGHAGLGLAIVKTLANELGLAVSCRSDTQGTTFQIAMASV